jgi:hypothetical protein
MLSLASTTQAQPPLSTEDSVDEARVLFPFMSIMFQTDFTVMANVVADEGWQSVEQGGNTVFCHENYAAEDNRFPVFLFGAESWQDYSVEARFQLTGTLTAHAAILTRLDAERWGYRHRLFFDPWGSGITQYYYGGEDGRESQLLGEYLRPVESGNWYVLRAETEGKIVRTVINGFAIAHYNVETNTRGSVGIEAGPGVRLCVDDVVVRSMDRSPTAMAGVKYGVVKRDANVRLLPSLTYARVGFLRSDEQVYVLGRSEDRHWVQIRKLRSFVQGWVWAEYLDEIIPPAAPAPLA